MPWKVTFNASTNRAGVGSATAVWTEATGESMTYTDDQINTNQAAQVTNFANRANNAKTAFQTALTAQKTIEAALTTALG